MANSGEEARSRQFIGKAQKPRRKGEVGMATGKPVARQFIGKAKKPRRDFESQDI